MTKILELLKLLPALIGVLMALIKVFEVPGHGTEKKEAVLAMVGLIFDFLGSLIELPIEKEKALDFVGKAIDAIVAFLNAINIFKHKEVNPTLKKTD